MSGFRSRVWLLPLGVAVFSFLLFLNTSTHPFVYDDHVLIVENTRLATPEYLSSLFNSSFQYDAPRLDYSSFQIDYYRPFVRLLFWIIYQIGGLNPVYWHVSNILLFSIVSALVWLVVDKLSGSRRVATVTALLFAAHPVHTEAVAYVNSLVETLHAIFFLSALLVYLIARDSSTKSLTDRGILYLGTLMLFESALLTKEAAVCLPIVIGVLELLTTEEGWKKRFLRGIQAGSFFLIAIAGYLLLRYVTYGRVLRVNSDMPLWKVFINIPQAITGYLKMLLYPVSLTMLNTLPLTESLLSPYFLLPVTILISVTLGLWLYASRMTFFYWAFLLITLMPVLHLGIFPLDRILQHRYVFIGSIGIFALLATGFEQLLIRAHRPAYVILGAVLIFLSVQTYKQNGYWKSEFTLYQREYALAPNSEFAANAYAFQLLLNGQPQEAARLFTHILQKMNPDSAFANLGMAEYYRVHEDYEQALHFFDRTITIQRGHRLDLYIALAECYEKIGRRGKGIEILRQVVKEHPKYLDAQKALSEMLKAEFSSGGNYVN